MRRFLAILLTAGLLTAGLAVGGGSPALALDDGLALNPPMGFNDWNAFGCDVSE